MNDNTKHAGALIAAVAALVTAISSCTESAEQSELRASKQIAGTTVDPTPGRGCD